VTSHPACEESAQACLDLSTGLLRSPEETAGTHGAADGKSVMQISAYYRYPLIVVLPYFNLKNQPDNYRLLSAITVFRNEPYS